MKSLKITIIALLGVAALSFAGCVKPVEPKELIEASPNETMFVVPLVGENKGEAQAKLNSREFYEQRKVAVKQIQVPHRWLQTGRLENTGRWIPSVMVIKVDRTPVTVEFAVDEQNKGQGGRPDGAKRDADAIWIESSDSVGFSVGFSVSAMVTEEDTSTFLYRYQSANL